MALNIPMPESPGKSLLQGLDTGSSMMSRIMQPVIERERMKQQQAQFAQDYILKKQAESRANALMPYMIQQYQDTHKTAANAAQMKSIYLGLMQDALKGGGDAGASPVPAPLPGMASQAGGGQPNAAPSGMPPQAGGMPQLGVMPPELGGTAPEVGNFLNTGGQLPEGSDNSQPVAPHPDLMLPQGVGTPSQPIPAPPQMGGMPSPVQGLPVGGQAPVAPSVPQVMPNQNMIDTQEHVLRPGNPRLSKMDAVAGLVPGIPKPVQHFSDGMLITSYPSGRITAQQIAGGNSTLRGPARDASDLEKLKNQAGENSEVYQNAKSAYDATLEAKKDLRDLRARTKAGIKPGEKEFFDTASGQPLGKEVPFTDKERQSEEGNIMFNELYPIVYKGAAPFSGEGSITRLQKAAANYKTDPQAKKLFDDFLLANKMLAATTVNEASTLKARGTNTTYQMLKSSLDAQDIPKVITKLISQYNIPASAQLTAAMRYQKALSDARIKARKTVPATQKLFYDPQKQAQYEQQDYTGSGATTTPSDKEVIVVSPDKKRFKTTEANAANLPEGWSRG